MRISAFACIQTNTPLYNSDLQLIVIAPDDEFRSQIRDAARARCNDKGARRIMPDLEKRFASIKPNGSARTALCNAQNGIGIQFDPRTIRQIYRFVRTDCRCVSGFAWRQEKQRRSGAHRNRRNSDGSNFERRLKCRAPPFVPFGNRATQSTESVSASPRGFEPEISGAMRP